MAEPRSRINRNKTMGKSGGMGAVRIIGTNTGTNTGKTEMVGVKREANPGVDIKRDFSKNA